VRLREKLPGASIEPAREEEETGVIMRSTGVVVVVVPVMLLLAACAGATDPQGDLSAGYPVAIVKPNAVPGELQESWPGLPFPLLSFEDREAIGRVTYAEAGNQDEEGIAAVIFTILNRVNSGQFGGSVQGVIDAPNQFEPATRAGGWRYLPPLDAWQSVQFETILNLILAGRLPDLTNGALFFQNAGIVAARASRGAASPYLVDFGGTPPVAQIGDHRFYDWRAAINLASRRYQGEDAQTAYGIGYEDGIDENLAVELGSGETSPESELPGGPPWNEQAMPAFADGVASEPLGAQQCAVSAHC
jgi:hypothetical protein